MSESQGSGAAELLDRVHRLTLAQKCHLLTGATFWSLPAEPAVGLGPVVVSDGPVGVRGDRVEQSEPSYLLPNPTAVAATWDRELATALGSLVGAQARERGVDVLLAPAVNLQRSPLGGRHFEYWSEDPLLTGTLAAGFVRGVQAHGVAATAKHFVGNEIETDRLGYDVRVDEAALRELYLRPFEMLVDAGVQVVMAAYNAVGGVSMTEHARLVDGVLKDEWGFDGVVVSDWKAARSTVGTALGGLDLVMPGPDGPWGARLVAAVEEGAVPVEVVDDKVLRVLRLAARVGRLRGAGARRSGGPAPRPAPALLREAAARSFVLLRNTGALPLAAGTVALIGANAVRLSLQGGGSAQVDPGPTTSLPDALGAATGSPVLVAVGAEHVRRSAPLTGEVRVTAVGRGGEVLATETRPTARLDVLGRVGLGATRELASEDIAEIRMRAVVHADAGPHEVEVAGAGTVTVLVDGVALPAGTLAAGADPLAAFVAPPVRRVPLRLTGAPAELEVRLRPESGRGAFSCSVALLPVGPGPDELMERAVEAARAADTAVVVVGTSAETETEGVDRPDLALPGRQDELVERVAAVARRTVVVVNAGGPVLLPWRDRVDAVLLAWLPGQEGAAALAEVLTGAREPGGRLPFSLLEHERDHVGLEPARGGTLDYREGRALGYRGHPGRGVVPAYEFGTGRGYTTWDYESLDVRGDAAGGLRVVVAVRNSGERDGTEVVQAYLRSGDGLAPRLVGYAVAAAAAGERTGVTIEVPARELDRWADGAWRRAPGPYALLVGTSSAATPLVAEGPFR